MISYSDVLSDVSWKLLDVLRDSGAIAVSVTFYPDDKGYDALHVSVEGDTDTIHRRGDEWAWNGDVGSMETMIDKCTAYMLGEYVLRIYKETNE